MALLHASDIAASYETSSAGLEARMEGLHIGEATYLARRVGLKTADPSEAAEEVSDGLYDEISACAIRLDQKHPERQFAVSWLDTRGSTKAGKSHMEVLAVITRVM